VAQFPIRGQNLEVVGAVRSGGESCHIEVTRLLLVAAHVSLVGRTHSPYSVPSAEVYR
jgi:hypothetical protein